MVSLISYNGPFKYSRRSGEIEDSGDVNFCVTPEYFPKSERKGQRWDNGKYPAGKQYLALPETKKVGSTWAHSRGVEMAWEVGKCIKGSPYS